MTWQPNSFEDKLLQVYCQKEGGIIFTEVSVGGAGDNWPEGSRIRWIDGVRIFGKSLVEEEIRNFFANKEEFRKLIKSYKIEIIEVKRKLNRPVIGQVIAGADMFERHYGVKPDKRTIVYKIKDPALRWVCERRGIELFKVSLNNCSNN